MPPSLAIPRRAVARTRPRPRSRARRRPPARLFGALLALTVLLAGGWLWFRQSSLVAVRDVTIAGATGPQSAAIEGALRDAAHDMTTLRVRPEALRTAVEPYPIVKGVEAEPEFPHGLRIVVHQYEPVGALVAAGTRIAVAADGTVLRDTPTAGLPLVTVAGITAGAHVEGRAATAVAVLAAAPAALRARVARLHTGPKGWTAPLTDGPVLYLGDPGRMAAKWIAAARVLEDPDAAGATYIDLRIPERPAAGGVLAPPQGEPSASTSG
jgi:cell division protein FtsQ